MTNEIKPNYVIFDTDMGADDAWALQLILKAEKVLKNVKVLAITIVNGNTTADNAIKNTYRILDGIGRNDVGLLIPVHKCTCFFSFHFIYSGLVLFRFLFTKALLKRSFRVIWD